MDHEKDTHIPTVSNAVSSSTPSDSDVTTSEKSTESEQSKSKEYREELISKFHEKCALLRKELTRAISSRPRRVKLVPQRRHCAWCSSDHSCDCCNDLACPKLLALSPCERRKTVNRSGRCTNCLGTHKKVECTSLKRCCFCRRRHHSVLHHARQRHHMSVVLCSHVATDEHSSLYSTTPCVKSDTPPCTRKPAPGNRSIQRNRKHPNSALKRSFQRKQMHKRMVTAEGFFLSQFLRSSAPVLHRRTQPHLVLRAPNPLPNHRHFFPPPFVPYPTIPLPPHPRFFC